jgi:hypothetical protein
MGHAFPFVVAVQGHPESWLYAMLTNIVVSKVVAFFQKKMYKVYRFHKYHKQSFKFFT